MLTGESIIGKVVSFIVNKTLGKLVALPFDKRRKACRSLTKLYYCVQALDDVTEDFLQTLDAFLESGDASTLIFSLNYNAYRIEMATNMFYDLGYELYEGLEIIDPALAECCCTLYVGKFDFLTFISKSIYVDDSTQAHKVIVKRPLGKMESADMEYTYELTKKALQDGDKYYWPGSALDDFSSDFEDISIEFEDKESAIQLREMIVRQNMTLKEAKERLRNLIKDSFSIEEVLFQTDSHPYR
ncbi:MAG: hypothetical protein PHU44_02885 [Syntrophales bacterium]|nr:hypothetical protein [Syntrophales bacterium]MDD5642504.1 hypothetical protein [Syntrophales bacterium]